MRSHINIIGFDLTSNTAAQAGYIFNDLLVAIFLGGDFSISFEPFKTKIKSKTSEKIHNIIMFSDMRTLQNSSINIIASASAICAIEEDIIFMKRPDSNRKTFSASLENTSVSSFKSTFIRTLCILARTAIEIITT